VAGSICAMSEKEEKKKKKKKKKKNKKKKKKKGNNSSAQAFCRGVGITISLSAVYKSRPRLSGIRPYNLRLERSSPS